MTSRIFSALLASALLAAPAFAQDGEGSAPPAEAAATESAGAPDSGGDSETSDPTKKDDEGSAAAAVSGGMVGMQAEDGAFPLHITGSLTNYLGQGTFISGGASNPYVATSLSVSPFALFGGFRFALAQTFDLEWTQSDATTYQNQVVWSDTGLQVAYPGLALPDLGLSFLLSGGASLPISLASRQQGRITSLSAGGQVAWTYAPFGLNVFTGASTNYNINIPSFASRAALDDVRPYEDRALGTLIPSSCVRRTASELGNYACGSIPSVAGYNVRAGGGWATLEGQLSFNATVALGQQFSSYLGPDDGFTAEKAQTGLQARDVFTTGLLQATYAPAEWFFLTVGTQTFQPLYTSRRDGVRVFPFWDFTSAANNFSSVFVDTTFMF